MRKTDRKVEIFLTTLDAYIDRMVGLGKPVDSIALTPAQAAMLRKLARKREHDPRFGRDTYRGLSIREHAA